MNWYNTLLLFFGLFFVINSIQCTEFVPVYMWSNKRTSEKIPALRKISQDSFKDDILEQLKYYDFIVVFAEQTLSPEDLVRQDEDGKKVFHNLAGVRKSAKVNYLPYVQSPIKALQHLDASVSEVFVDSIKDKFSFPKTDILVVDLNDAGDSENRIDMLKRHDELIASICKKINKEDKNVLTLYTAHHESWITSEDVTNSRRARSLLATDVATDAPTVFFNDSNILAYYSKAIIKDSPSSKNSSFVNITLTLSSTKTANLTTIKIESVTPQLEISLIFANTSSTGYWELLQITSTYKSEQVNISTPSLYAPYGFSYHCGDQSFSNEKFHLVIKDFQIELYETEPPASNKFNDAYDCVGFTTVPIWSGLFVTAILLLILTFGITMMMDIRTMDRFDDPKGKTITINAE